MRTLIVVLAFVTFGFFDRSITVTASECKTGVTVIQPKQDVSEDDNQQYVMINIPGFEQNATSIECLSNQTCEKSCCQQDYKLHQFLSLPKGKQQFELEDLKFRFFKIPYGCKCTASL